MIRFPSKKCILQSSASNLSNLAAEILKGWTPQDPHGYWLCPTVQPVQPILFSYTRARTTRAPALLIHFYRKKVVGQVGRSDTLNVYAALRASNLSNLSNLLDFPCQK